jgi:hypothetical protein
VTRPGDNEAAVRVALTFDARPCRVGRARRGLGGGPHGGPGCRRRGPRCAGIRRRCCGPAPRVAGLRPRAQVKAPPASDHGTRSMLSTTRWADRLPGARPAEPSRARCSPGPRSCRRGRTPLRCSSRGSWVGRGTPRAGGSVLGSWRSARRAPRPGQVGGPRREDTHGPDRAGRPRGTQPSPRIPTHQRAVRAG